jgi:hypothetical protein
MPLDRESSVWKKRGLIYVPDGSGYFKTHAARPVPYRLNDRTLRLFYSSRDADDRMLPTYVDVDIRNPSQIAAVPDQPLTGLGDPGCFDDSGVTLGSAIDVGDEVRFYYTGWKRRRVVSFELAIGILVWDKTAPVLHRRFQGPILAQDINHPLLVAGPFVLFDDGRFKMWYCSGTAWRFPNNNPEPIYTVFYAESDDGISWRPHGAPVIPYKFDGEVISAPWIVKDRDKYRMWYSRRGHETEIAKRYVAGFAESADGVQWKRLDEQTGIAPSETGWDSEMLCYPALFPFEESIYMFYSGNRVGRGGLGYAIADNFLK